jgi:pimeloyl-ACP methyl ester carboxylesterase
MATLACTSAGAGPPLVLLPGIGSSRHVWDPVIPALARQFDVLAVDLPGFGDSAALPAHLEPRPAILATAVAEFLDERGITAPHIVGNSLGGWVALELAQIRTVASLSLLSPAGLWRGDTPRYCRASLRATRWLTRSGGRVLSWLVGHRLGRSLVFCQIQSRPVRLTPDYARQAIRDMADGEFDAALAATARRRYRAGSPIDAPTTVAFGSRDRLLLPGQSRHLDELPSDTHIAQLRGCGHVPMSDDPAAVAALIMSATARQPTDGGAARLSGSAQP